MGHSRPNFSPKLEPMHRTNLAHAMQLNLGMHVNLTSTLTHNNCHTYVFDNHTNVGGV